MIFSLLKTELKKCQIFSIIVYFFFGEKRRSTTATISYTELKSVSTELS